MHKGNRPPLLPYEASFLEKFSIWMGVLGLIVLIVLPFFYWMELPDTIPTHYTLQGEPDAYGDKMSIVFMPILGLGIWGLLFFLSRNPVMHNFPLQVTEQNAQRLYQTSIKFLHVLNLIVVWFFAYINYSTIQVALGFSEGFSGLFGFAFIASVLGLSGYYFFLVRKLGK